MIRAVNIPNTFGGVAIDPSNRDHLVEYHSEVRHGGDTRIINISAPCIPRVEMVRPIRRHIDIHLTLALRI